jgi:hypothetical protein
MKLINTIPNENRNTIHGIVEFVPDSVFSAFLPFAKIILF